MNKNFSVSSYISIQYKVIESMFPSLDVSKDS